MNEQGKNYLAWLVGVKLLLKKIYINYSLFREAVGEHKFNFIKKPQAGFEPATHTLRGYCSNQLSY